MNQSNHHGEIAIKLVGVSKKYEIHHEKPTLVEKFVKGKNETFWALQNINLTLRKGEKVGIIGPNGSGKTTLLKIIAGITTPTHGTITIHGKVVSLIDLEAGFHMDLTGIQNIYLNGMLLGMNKTEISQKLHLIIDFADIRQFIDVPLYTYSDGMKFRLGFSIAAHANPDIIVLDEGIITGDLHFQKKVANKIKQICRKNVTLLIVSQSESILRNYTTKLILINHGTIIQTGGGSLFSKYAQQKHDVTTLS